jgi:DNA polymerase V
MKIAFFEETVAAGFAAHAEDFIQKNLDLHELMVEHPTATFFVRVRGDSMVGAGIHSEDVLVVDRARLPSSGKVVVALLNGEFTVKRLIYEGKRICLQAENPDYLPIIIQPGDDFQVWGVVTYVIHKL